MNAHMAAVAVWVAPASSAAAAPAYTAKVVKDTAPPKELSEAVAKLMQHTCVQVLNAKEDVILEIWLAKEPEAKATEQQVKNGLTYREVPQSTVMGAVRVPKMLTDYKKQKIPAGVYTLRLAIQPEDGDHMGTAPYNEFCLLCPAAEDKDPALLEVKKLRELSAKTTENHPGVLVLFPADKDAGDEAKIVSKTGGHWVVFVKMTVVVGKKKVTLPFGLNVIGSSNA